MLFCLANLATSLIFLMESSSSRFSSAMPLRGVAAMALGVDGVAAPGVDGFTAPGVDAFRWPGVARCFAVCIGRGSLSVLAHLSRAVQQCSDCGLVLWLQI
jgi:hypothetical protein